MLLVIISLGNQAGILVHLIAEYFTDYSFQTYNFIKEAQSQSRNQLCANYQSDFLPVSACAFSFFLFEFLLIF